MVWLTICLFCLDWAALLMSNKQQFYLLGQIQPSQTGGQPYSDTSPYGECPLIENDVPSAAKSPLDVSKLTSAYQDHLFVWRIICVFLKNIFPRKLRFTILPNVSPRLTSIYLSLSPKLFRSCLSKSMTTLGSLLPMMKDNCLSVCLLQRSTFNVCTRVVDNKIINFSVLVFWAISDYSSQFTFVCR